MSNSSLVNYYRWSPNHSGTRNHSIDIITIHMVVGQCAVETLGDIFANPGRQASSNYGIGYDGRIGQYVDESNRSWCSSSSWNDNRAITIETASDTYYPYAVNYAAYISLINLCADICKRNGKTKMVWYPTWDEFETQYGGHNDGKTMYMTLHRWFAATSCPGAYLEECMSDIASRVTGIIAPDPDPPKPKPEPVKPTKTYSDVDYKQGYAKAVTWGTEKGIIKGYSDGTFRPDDICTRAQFVTMLWRMYGKPEPEYTKKDFTDVKKKSSDYKPIMWADEQGIIKGYSDGSFRPKENVTRTQVAVILWRLAKKPKPKSNVSYFDDVYPWSANFYAIQWGKEAGLIKGYSDDTFRPDNVCVRKEAITFLYRFAKKFM